VVLSTEPPLIICDRDTIPINVGDIFITFANSIIIPGKLLYLHPMYNYAILTYEKRLLGETPVMKKTIVTSIGNVGTKECSPPRWRAMNVEGIRVDDHL